MILQSCVLFMSLLTSIWLVSAIACVCSSAIKSFNPLFLIFASSFSWSLFFYLRSM